MIWALDGCGLAGRRAADRARRSAPGDARPWRREPDLMAEIELPDDEGVRPALGGDRDPARRLLADPAIAELADDLHERVLENEGSEAEDGDMGRAGTLVAARTMLSGPATSAGARRGTASADALWSHTTKRAAGRSACTARSTGARDGARARRERAGAPPLLDERTPEAARARTSAVLARRLSSRTAWRTGPSSSGRSCRPPPERSGCSGARGAPGIVVAAPTTSTRSFCSRCGGSSWKAGPPTTGEGAGICHGTAGNGYALLAAFGRTGDEQWLERARAFAAHALGQVERVAKPLLALDRRRRRRGLRRRLPRGEDPLPRSRLNPGLAGDRQRLAVRAE